MSMGCPQYQVEHPRQNRRQSSSFAAARNVSVRAFRQTVASGGYHVPSGRARAFSLRPAATTLPPQGSVPTAALQLAERAGYRQDQERFHWLDTWLLSSGTSAACGRDPHVIAVRFIECGPEPSQIFRGKTTVAPPKRQTEH